MQIEASTVEIEERGVKLRLTVVDTPGYGDAINSQDWCVYVPWRNREWQLAPCFPLSMLSHPSSSVLNNSPKFYPKLPISYLYSHCIPYVLLDLTCMCVCLLVCHLNAGALSVGSLSKIHCLLIVLEELCFYTHNLHALLQRLQNATQLQRDKITTSHMLSLCRIYC